MEYKKIKISQRLFLSVLSEIYNWNLHRDTSGRYKHPEELGLYVLSAKLLLFEKFIEKKYNMYDVLYHPLDWAQSAKIPNEVSIIEYLNMLRPHFNEMIKLLGQVKTDKLIEIADELYLDLNKGEYHDTMNPLGTVVDMVYNETYKTFIRNMYQ